MFAAFALTVVAGRVKRARVAYGGSQAFRSAHCDRAGADWQPGPGDRAHRDAGHDCGFHTPMTDMRATAAYRMQIAQNLLLRFWLETGATRRSAGAVMPPLSHHAEHASQLPARSTCARARGRRRLKRRHESARSSMSPEMAIYTDDIAAPRGAVGRYRLCACRRARLRGVDILPPSCGAGCQGGVSPRPTCRPSTITAASAR